ncbi:hypothetical protein CR155_20510 [Pollutimonas nitritireducens]|uniref:Uncharacterized protein n=1 Tax=Pollutimonas nitritireducens TaxID=2045209 RepID=A0A2N4UAE2_9BURK|nr:hypothetical protein [Pollutimonas nitritireducens]PLC51991.1 hypothetical protein CR155_20510 [Pollutimonas nitritireducens]
MMKSRYYCLPAKERFAKRYAVAADVHSTAKQAVSVARNNGDKVGLQKAEHALKEAGVAVDKLDLFKKNLKSFVKLYEFLSQIIDYEDRELEQLNVYAKHLQPLLQVSRLEDEDVDVSELELTHYRLTKRAEHALKLNENTGEYGLKPGSDVGTGKPHDPEKKRLSEIIDALNDLFGAEISDDDQLHFANGVAARISRDAEVMAQVNGYSKEQVMHGVFPKRIEDVVLDAMTENEKMAMEILGDQNKGRDFALLILRLLAGYGKSGAPPLATERT